MFNKSNSSNSSKYQKVDIVIPAFNEEESVASVVNVIKQLDYINNIIVVNDGSTDNTHNEAKNAGAIVIDHINNKGKGAAIQTGVNASTADIIAFIDADIKNLTPKKVDIIIKPILKGKADITKTKFARESGRVTELTAKPLLKFFFPEVNYEQPLSGQFAGKRSILKKLKFESDYGVDVGIVLDADVRGIKILEVDIGDIQHDMSPLSDLHQMANEVVRTIISRAVNYGRLTMIDSLGNYIRMSILGLSLIILGLFLVFFVQPVPFQLGILIGIIGIVIAVFYLIKLVVKSVVMFRKSPANKNVLKSFIKMHFPIIIVFFLLILMISTFMSATTIGDNGQISIEATSRNLVIFGQGSSDHIAVRGPYTVDSAIENESNIIRMPFSAMQTLQMIYGDTIIFGDTSYTINQTRPGEDNILRLPSSARAYLGVRSGNVISNSRISNVFYKSYVKHTVRASNISNLNYNITENYNIAYSSGNATEFDIYIDNQYITSSSAILYENKTYYVDVNGDYLGSFLKNNLSDNKSIEWNYSNHNIKLVNKGYTSSIRDAYDSKKGVFLNFDLSTLNDSSNDVNETYSDDSQQ